MENMLKFPALIRLATYVCELCPVTTSLRWLTGQCWSAVLHGDPSVAAILDWLGSDPCSALDHHRRVLWMSHLRRRELSPREVR